MNKQAGKYAGQPAGQPGQQPQLPPQGSNGGGTAMPGAMPGGMPGMGGMAANHAFYPFGHNSTLIANAPNNPASQPAAPQPGMATTQGIQAAMSKVSEWGFGAQFNWLKEAVEATLALSKSADSGVSSVGAAGEGHFQGKNEGATLPGKGLSQTKSVAAPTNGNQGQGGHQSALGGGAPKQQTGATLGGLNPLMGNNPLVTAGRAGWAGLTPGTSSPVSPPAFGKAAGLAPGGAGMQPTPGLTANMPPPPPGMAPAMPPGGMPPGAGGAMPPGAPPGMPPGAAGGVPPPAPGGAPPGGGMQPPMPGGMLPPTAPMSDAPPQPLPVNPRPSQPSPKTSQQAMQEANMLGLQEMKNTPDASGAEDLKDQGMAMGAKMALYQLHPNTAFWKSAFSAVPEGMFASTGLPLFQKAMQMNKQAPPKPQEVPALKQADLSGPLSSMRPMSAGDPNTPNVSYAQPRSVPNLAPTPAAPLPGGPAMTSGPTSAVPAGAKTGADVEDSRYSRAWATNADPRFGAKCPHCGSHDTIGARAAKMSADGSYLGPANTACNGCGNGFSVDIDAVKSAAQAHDGSYTPKRSATGESTGLSFANRPDDYAQGQEAWAATSKYFKTGGRKKAPNPFVGDHDGKQAEALSPFASGFFTRCDALGLTPEQTALAVEKVGSDYGEDARTELLDGLEKRGWPGAGMLRSGVNMAKSWAPRLFGAAGHEAAPAANVARQVMPHGAANLAPLANAGNVSGLHLPVASQASFLHANPTQPLGGMGMRALREGGQTALGAAGGYMEGENLPGPAQTNNPGLWGAVEGGVAFNPTLRRMAAGRGARSALNPLIQGGRAGILGSIGGQMLDMPAGWAGLDTNFGRLGGMLGTGAGAYSGTGRAMRGMSAPGSAIHNQGQRMMAQGTGALEQITSPLQHLRPMLPEGVSTALGILPGNSLSRIGATHLERPALAGLNLNNAARQGRNMAIGAGGILGARELLNGATRHMTEHGVNTANQYMQAALPQIGDYAEERARGMMNNMGVLNEQGQVDPMHMLGNAMRSRFGGGAGGPGVMQHVDSLFRGLGMDPTRMSPLQKLMILGGTGAAGGGMLAGSPMLAGAGGLSLLGGALPALMHGSSSQGGGSGVAGNVPGSPPAGHSGPIGLPPNAPGQRNEFEYQQRLQRG